MGHIHHGQAKRCSTTDNECSQARFLSQQLAWQSSHLLLWRQAAVHRLQMLHLHLRLRLQLLLLVRPPLRLSLVFAARLRLRLLLPQFLPAWWCMMDDMRTCGAWDMGQAQHRSVRICIGECCCVVTLENPKASKEMAIQASPQE